MVSRSVLVVHPIGKSHGALRNVLDANDRGAAWHSIARDPAADSARRKAGKLNKIALPAFR